jgi:hypothetical protein
MKFAQLGYELFVHDQCIDESEPLMMEGAGKGARQSSHWLNSNLLEAVTSYVANRASSGFCIYRDPPSPGRLATITTTQ